MIFHKLVSNRKPLGPIISVLEAFLSLVTLIDLEGEAQDHITRLPANDFLQVGFTCQTSRTNNKGLLKSATWSTLALFG